MASKEKPVLEFYYDISCPFAYIASTRIEALAARTNAHLIWTPVLLGGIYRATSAPQGAAGSASDVFNPTKKTLTSTAFTRTLKRYQIPLHQPSKHPQKTTAALRLLCSLPNEERPALSKTLFKAYWVDNEDVTDRSFLLDVARRCGVTGVSDEVFDRPDLHETLRTATDAAVSRGAPGVPSFWIPDERWTDSTGRPRQGRLYWGQDRMHFVEAALLALQNGGTYERVPDLAGLQPRCLRVPVQQKRQVKLEFWFDFSSPWAFLGWTQLERLKREAGIEFEIEMKPFLLGGLFRQIGAPMMPILAMSPQKRAYNSLDQADWTRHWNAISQQNNSPDNPVVLRWPDIFPIRSPNLLRVAMVEPKTTPVLFRAAWSQNTDVSTPAVLAATLSAAGFDGPGLLQDAGKQELKDQLRANNDAAVQLGLCGAPTYRVLQKTGGEWEVCGGLVWGQDETAVVLDLIAGWDEEASGQVADVSDAHRAEGGRTKARL